MDLVIVAQYPSTAEASLALNLLRDEGIDATLADAETGDLFHLTADFGEVKVMAPSDQADRARAIIDEVRARAALAEDPTTEEEDEDEEQ